MIDLLVCPSCRNELKKIGTEKENFLLRCSLCGRIYPVIDGIAILCDDSRKNKNLEISFLSSFMGKMGTDIDHSIAKEIKRIGSLNIQSNWEWDDVTYWDARYKQKWEEKEKYSREKQFALWKDRIWQRMPLARKLCGSVDNKKQNLILEVGSGEGQNAILFDRYPLPNQSYIASDMSFYALKLAKYFNSKTFPNSFYILCPADRIPLKNEAVDIITCFGILHHCPEKEKTLLALNPLLKNKGFLVLYEPYNRPSITPGFLKNKEPESAHEERIDPSLFKKTIKDLGYFTLKQDEGYGVFYGFLSRFFPKIVILNEVTFGIINFFDKIFINSLKGLAKAFGPGDVRGLYRKA